MLVVSSSCSKPSVYTLSKTQSIKIDTLQIENIDFYLETSASMKGYINTNISGTYSLKDVVPFLITDLEKNYDLETTLHTISDESRAYPNSKNVFFNQLREGSLLNGKSSKLQRVFRDVISNTKDNSLSFLVSDCIVDLGNTDSMAEGSLVTNEIYQNLIHEEEMGIAVFKYLSDFNGDYYYDRKNTGARNISKRPYHGTVLTNRPFYIWVFGHKNRVRDLVYKNIIKGYSQSHMYNISLDEIKYDLLEHPKSGKIAVNPDKKNLLIKEIDKKRPAKFTIALKAGNQKNSIHQIISTAKNYRVTPSFLENSITIEVKDAVTLLSEKIPNKSYISNAGYSHFIQPKLTDFDTSVDDVKIHLINETPSWINEATIDDDFGIPATQLEYKTFAFKYITSAFEKAFVDDNSLLEFTLTKQQKQ